MQNELKKTHQPGSPVDGGKMDRYGLLLTNTDGACRQVVGMPYNLNVVCRSGFIQTRRTAAGDRCRGTL